MAATIKDVAREAGVSISTVSKVLNGWSTISPATVSRVNEVISKLNYTPNARAVSFAKQTTRNIVFLTSLEKEEAYRNPHMFDIMCGVNNELSKNNYTMTLLDTSVESYPGETVERVLNKKAADGMVVHGSAINKETASLLIKEQFPHIIIGHPGFENQLCWVDTNHALAGQYAAMHMINCGYKNIAFIGGRKTDHISMQRLKGFLGTMQEYGYFVPGSMVCYTDSSVEESYQAVMNLFRDTANRPRAIICSSNTIAVGVVKGIRELGLHIPEDIAFLTFDKYPYSKIIEPAPTVVDINVYDIGLQAGTLILNKIKNPSMQIQSYTTLPVIETGATTMHIS
jgi:LacI family transcriptional regulator